jgi:hypothetical protein
MFLLALPRNKKQELYMFVVTFLLKTAQIHVQLECGIQGKEPLTKTAYKMLNSTGLPPLTL